MKKKVLITGTNGQDGSFLSEFLLQKGYQVHGIIRRASVFNTERIEHLMENEDFILHYGDITDSHVINNLVSSIKPDQIYNLAAQSHVQVSFQIPYYTGQVDALGTLNILEAVKNHSPETKVYNATTSELFGKVQETPQNEDTPFYPRSPYGVAKLYSYWIAKNYKEAYNLFICNGILFNHSSERRPPNFILRKITYGLSKIYYQKEEVLKLGNLNAQRDIGYAKDYVEGMWLMMQQDEPEDFVLSTNQTHSIRQFIEKAAPHFGWQMEWQGKGLEEKGYDKETGKLLVEVDPSYFRPTEVDLLIGDYSKAKKKLEWEPKTNINEIIKIMAENDLKL